MVLSQIPSFGSVHMEGDQERRGWLNIAAGHALNHSEHVECPLVVTQWIAKGNVSSFLTRFTKTLAENDK